MRDLLIEETLEALPDDAAEGLRYELSRLTERAGPAAHPNELAFLQHEIAGSMCVGVAPDRAVAHARRKIELAKENDAGEDVILALNSDLALRLGQAGDLEGSLEAYNALIDAHVDGADGRVRLHLSDAISSAAGLLAGAGRFSDAVELLRRGAGMFSEGASSDEDTYLCEITSEIGCVQSHAGHWDAAVTAYERSIAIASRIKSEGLPVSAFEQRLAMVKAHKPVPAIWSAEHPLW